jgi:putative two-component system response regulator
VVRAALKPAGMAFCSPETHSVPNYKILVVDDQPVIRQIASTTLRSQGYQIFQAENGEVALSVARAELPDLILLDVRMPGISGFEVCRIVKTDQATKHIKVVMLTGEILDEDRQEGFRNGADEYFTKPFSPLELLKKIRELLEGGPTVEDPLRGGASPSAVAIDSKAGALVESLGRRIRSTADLQLMERNQLVIYSQELGVIFGREVEKSAALQEALHRLEEAQRRLEQAHEETILRLSIAAEYRDDDTASHIQRMSTYSEALARRMGLTDEQIVLVKRASPMHDVGKIGIRDAILMKPGKYTPEEFEEMRSHTIIGARILQGSASELLQVGEVIALNHHEKWDGSGYPNGLSGASIPLVARIVSLADVFDALTTRRCYKPPFTVEVALEIINQGIGTHFDPNVVQAFLGGFDEILQIRARFGDAEEE